MRGVTLSLLGALTLAATGGPTAASAKAAAPPGPAVGFSSIASSTVGTVCATASVPAQTATYAGSTITVPGSAVTGPAHTGGVDGVDVHTIPGAVSTAPDGTATFPGLTLSTPGASATQCATLTSSSTTVAVPGTTTAPTTAAATTTVATTAPPPPDGWWAWDAMAGALDPNSETLVSTWLTYFPEPGYMTLGQWGVATADSTPSSPCYAVPVTSGGTVDPTVCIPLGSKPDPAGDGHLTIRDTANGRETDFWQATYDATTQRITSASSGASFPLGFWTEQMAPCGWAGNAACFPLGRGIVTPADIASGTIDHPLVFSSPEIGGTSTSYRYPATHNAPTCGTDCTNHLVEGTWLRMDPAVSCSSLGLPAWQAMICVALQRYGMFLRDNGGQVAIYGVTPINQGGAADWTSVGLPGGSDSIGFSTSFPWSRLQVLQPPGP
ncbi:MAG: hypothetical protein ACXVZ2_00415 [Gaiellaceae bacterium]